MTAVLIAIGVVAGVGAVAALALAIADKEAMLSAEE